MLTPEESFNRGEEAECASDPVTGRAEGSIGSEGGSGPVSALHVPSPQAASRTESPTAESAPLVSQR